MVGFLERLRAKVQVGTSDAGKTDIIIWSWAQQFINDAAGEQVVEVGHGLRPCTTKVKGVRCSSRAEDRSVVLVDTPAFDENIRSIEVIADEIAKWLKESGSRGAQIAGIVYLHDITKSKMTGSPQQYLATFRKLCRGDPVDKVILATTHWEKPPHPQHVSNENEIKQKHWRQDGAFVTRFELGSAWDVLAPLLV